MADPSTEKPDAAVPASDVAAAAPDEGKPDQAELTSAEKAKSEDAIPSNSAEEAKENSADKAEKNDEKSAEADTEMADAADTTAAEPDLSAADATKTPNKTPSNNRRKSGGAASTRKSLSKKASKARITHLDAKPGDHFLVKLKGFPEWPAIICDESMLPQALLTTRPVTAARPDGSYAEAYADGGKRVNDRTFPVMYLHTNEFGWVVNTALTELTSEMAQAAMEGKIRKDLKAAFELAAEQYPLEHFKDILKKFEEEVTAHEEAVKAAAATPKKSKKGKAKETTDEDVEMEDAGESSKAKTKKRKAEDDSSTPQRSDSVKKPKIKLNTSSTPKAAANGTAAPAKEPTAVKVSKSKPKKSGEKKPEAKEAKLTPEERHQRKEKEVLYLRHKLQRGLLTGDTTPQETEMKQMSDYLQMLESFDGIEVSIIRATKINKVLKAILKLGTIPREEEFNFKSRSKTLLDKWNKLMADGTPTPAAASTNGVNGASKAHAEEGKADSTNTVPEKEKATATEPEKSTEEASTKKDDLAEPEKGDAEAKSEEKGEEAADKATEAVEATA